MKPENLSLTEFAIACSITEKEVGKDTYFYINMRGEPDYVQKRDRHSRPADEKEAYGYVAAHEGGISAVRRALSARR